MNEIETIRARHERCTPAYCCVHEMEAATTVSCDTVRVLAECTVHWRDDAERLATVLRASPTDCALDDDERRCWVHGAPWPSLDDDCDWSSARARALAAHDEMKCDDEET